FVLAIYLQEGAGLSATLAGLASLPVTILMILLSSRVGALAGRWGARGFMTVGPLVMAVGSAMLLLVGSPFDYWWQVLPGMVVFGLGLTITVSPLTSTILGAIGPEQSGIASAVNNAVSRVAGLIAVAMIGSAIGGSLDLDGFHRSCLIVSALLAAGGVVSWLGIRDAQRREPVGP
ncbi:MAG: MFS transporter, partial [Microbacterium gubbeenense]|uniref:MFS transporter n=1 Tax=Microbacterium gubbeenense TaxID=159896 RepID=UPI003F9D37DF